MIKNIEWNKHPKLGNLTLDFTNENGNVYNTIILAGENGCGKTSILDSINLLFTKRSLPDASINEIELLQGNNSISINKETQEKDGEKLLDRQNYEECLSIFDEDEYNKAKKLIELDDIAKEQEKIDTILCSENIIYSEARSGFDINMNSPIVGHEKDGANYTGLVQLLIDLEREDKNLWWDFTKDHKDISFDEFMKSYSKLSHFKNAFESMFEGTEYIGTKLEDGSNKDNLIYFKKNNVVFDINSLSTGEKQIVFRGTDLLSHYKGESIVLIDEPELSLHPKWQKKILNFYRNLFADENHDQNAQLIFATHSEYVVQQGVKDLENVKIIILNDENGTIKSDKMTQMLLGSDSISEINYLAFGVDELGYHIQLFAALHNICRDSKKIKGVGSSISSFDRFIKKHCSYDEDCHNKIWQFGSTIYYTIPVYIRNSIDHPDEGKTYTTEEIITSLDLLRKIFISVQ